MPSLPPARDVLGRAAARCGPADRSDPSGWGPPPTLSGPLDGRRLWVVVLAVGLALVVLVAAVRFAGFRAADRQQAATPALVQEGSCVRSARLPGRLEPAACDNPAAVGRVISLVAGGFAARLCPDDTDLAGTSQLAQTLCVRHRHGPHPGAAGQGGGVLRVGDCVVDVDRVGLGPVREVACAEPKAAYQVAARVVRKVRCPDGTSRLLEVQQTPRPKACLIRFEAVHGWVH
jgi:hypothetical protein